MKASDYEAAFEARPGRTAFRALVIVLLVIVGLSIVGWVISAILYAPQQAARVLQKTFDADNMIYNYEWFKRQYRDIGAMDQKLTAAEQAQAGFETSAGARDTWKFDDRQEWGRLNTITLGLRNQRASMVAEYNAKASMANRSIFMGSDVPDSVQ